MTHKLPVNAEMRPGAPLGIPCGSKTLVVVLALSRSVAELYIPTFPSRFLQSSVTVSLWHA